MRASFDFPQQLAEKYRPRRVREFLGLERAKRILTEFAANPYPSVWLFVGPSGLGKTTMAQALAEQIPAQLHHVSAKCKLETMEEICRKCYFSPRRQEDWKPVRFHLCLVDEADSLTDAVQLAFLSKLDSTASPPGTIFVFTANSAENFGKRFISRCKTIWFTYDGMAEALTDKLQSIWVSETKNEIGTLDFIEIEHEAQGNVRTALGLLEKEIMLAISGHRPERMTSPKPNSSVARSLQMCSMSKTNLLAEISPEMSVAADRSMSQAELTNRISKQLDLPARAERVRELVAAARCCIIEIGRELMAAKHEISHGEWLPWLTDNFGWSQQTASNYMRVAEAFGKLPAVGNLDDLSIEPRALYLLAGRNGSDEVRKQAVDKAKQGRTITLKEARRMIAEHHKEAAGRVAAELAEQRRLAEEETARKVAEVEARLDAEAAESKEKAKELATELARIKADEKKPTVNDAEALFKRLTGRNTLTKDQLAALYLAMNEPMPPAIAEHFSKAISGRVARTAGNVRGGPMQSITEHSTWMWACLLDVERDGLLVISPSDIAASIEPHMKADVIRVLPRFRSWISQLERKIGK